MIPRDRIFYIHGKAKDEGEDIVVGHNSILEELPELDDNGDSNRTMFTDSENEAKSLFNKLKKPVDEIIYQNQALFESIKAVKDIFVLGHSLNEIDLPYFEMIAKGAKCANWYVSYNLKEEKETFCEILHGIGVLKSTLKVKPMDELTLLF